MFRTAQSRSLVQGLWVVLCLSICTEAFAQAADKKIDPLDLPFPLKMEFSQSINPWDLQGLMATDLFKLSLNIKKLSLQYSNQMPFLLAGTQFQALPNGYKLAEFQWKEKWGSVLAFRSNGYDSRFIPSVAARQIEGAGFELPKSLFGSRISGSFLRASSSQDPPSGAAINPSPEGSQASFALVRNFKNGIKFQSEWTQSWQPVASRQEDYVSGRGLFMMLSGNFLKTETLITYRAQGQGYATPVAPVQGRGRNLVVLNLTRAYKKHRFQYTNQLDSQAGVLTPYMPFVDVHQESFIYTYAPKRFPQLSASQTWTSQSSTGMQEREGNLRLTINKNAKRFTLSAAYLRGTRLNCLTLLPLWHTSSLASDASLEIRKNRKLIVHYEATRATLFPSMQLIDSQILLLNTRVSYWGEKIAFIPSFDFRRQADSKGNPTSETDGIILSTCVKLPRRVPAKDLLLTFNSRRAWTAGLPDQNTTTFAVHWNFKRL
jgi:hypothetical protein